MRIRFVVLWFFVATAAAFGGPAAIAPPYEIVKDHVDIEVAKDGTYVESREESYRVLGAEGINLLHERRFSFTHGFESLKIVTAYTLKADGRRIEVPPEAVLSGFGQSSGHGFQDNHVISVFYPNLEVGDCVVLVTLFKQVTPWFADTFDFRAKFSRIVAAHDVVYALTAPAAMPIKIDADGLDADAPQTNGDKKRWIWRYHNDTPVVLENDAVDEADFAPHLALSTFADYSDVARAYRERAEGRGAVTPAIAALADQLTAGAGDKREQARILYDWVSTNISYVAIVLGAGGFTPHAAKDVLANRFGDCKDHAVLLEALLAAKDIPSTAVLIKIGANAYKLPAAASPHAFDHVITYLPGFDLFVDSTARFAPFGVLPYSDVGKPVLRVDSGAVTRTPVPGSASSSVRTLSSVELKADGSAEGHTKITARGAYGVHLRALMQSLAAGKETEFLRLLLGPGAEGAIDRGKPLDLGEPYTALADYRLPNAAAFPGPGALPFGLSFKPFSFTELVAGHLPSMRSSDYVCPSLAAEDILTVTLPEGVRLLSIPDSRILKADGIRLQIDYDRKNQRTVVQTMSLKLDHPQASCTADYYASVYGDLAKMAKTLRQQIIYRGLREADQ